MQSTLALHIPVKRRLASFNHVPAIGSLQMTGCVHVHLGHWTGFMQGTAGYNAWQAAGRHPKDFASCRHPLKLPHDNLECFAD
jgi:hypothetical protein